MALSTKESSTNSSSTRVTKTTVDYSIDEYPITTDSTSTTIPSSFSYTSANEAIYQNRSVDNKERGKEDEDEDDIPLTKLMKIQSKPKNIKNRISTSKTGSLPSRQTTGDTNKVRRPNTRASKQLSKIVSVTATKTTATETTKRTASPSRRRKRKITPKMMELQCKVELRQTSRKNPMKRPSDGENGNNSTKRLDHRRKEGLQTKKKGSKVHNSNHGVALPVLPTRKDDATQDSNDDDEEDIDEEEIVCCLCRCGIDYSERSAFHWPAELDTNTKNKSEGIDVKRNLSETNPLEKGKDVVVGEQGNDRKFETDPTLSANNHNSNDLLNSAVGVDPKVEEGNLKDFNYLPSPISTTAIHEEKDKVAKEESASECDSKNGSTSIHTIDDANTKDAEKKDINNQENNLTHLLKEEESSDYNTGDATTGTATDINKKDEGSKQPDDKSSDDSQTMLLPNSLYDPNNAILICDAPGCNRSYHQRCHFVPVLFIPRGEWHCLICQFKNEQLQKQRQNKRKQQRQTKKKTNPESKQFTVFNGTATSINNNNYSSDDGEKKSFLKSLRVPIPIESLSPSSAVIDSIYPMVKLEQRAKEKKARQENDKEKPLEDRNCYPPNDATEIPTTTVAASVTHVSETSLPVSNQDGVEMDAQVTNTSIFNGSKVFQPPTNTDPNGKAARTITSKATLNERFEFQSSQLKSTLLTKELVTKMKSMISINLSRIRLSQNTIRAYTETNRARKALIENYETTGKLPQELIQSVLRMGSSKLRIRSTFESLKKIIQNYDEVGLLERFISGESVEINVVDKDLIEDVKHHDGNCHDGGSKFRIGPNEKYQQMIDFASSSIPSSSNLFVGCKSIRRKEPRFNIEDYDGSEDEDENEERENNNSNKGNNKSRTGINDNSNVGNIKDAIGGGWDSSDKTRCTLCFSGHTTLENDILMCDGEHCFRSYHMKCLTPNVTQKMLDDDPDGTWFCPFCTSYANFIHYVQVEYWGDEWQERIKLKDEEKKSRLKCSEKDDGNTGDNCSEATSSSWGDANDVFPEAIFEETIAKKWKEGYRDEKTDELLGSLLGITMRQGDQSDGQTNDIDGLGGQDDDEDDDGDFGSEKGSCGSSLGTAVSGSSSSDDVSSVDWDIDRSEINELSSCSSVGESSESASSEEMSCEEKKSCSTLFTGKRKRGRWRLRKRRFMVMAQNTASSGTQSEDGSRTRTPPPDVGTLDKSNIIHGKRNRTKVDYRRLNDAMFGCFDPSEVAIALGDIGDDDYKFAAKSQKKKTGGRRKKTFSDISSDDENGSDDNESSSEERKGKKNTRKKQNNRRTSRSPQKKLSSSKSSNKDKDGSDVNETLSRGGKKNSRRMPKKLKRSKRAEDR